MQPTKLGKSYDVVIYGESLGALLLTKQLRRLNKKVALVTKQSTPEGLVQRLTKGWHSGFNFLPNEDQVWHSINTLKHLFPENLTFTPGEKSPVTFDSGSFKEFLGFGNKDISKYEFIQQFLIKEQIETNIPLCSIVEKLIADIAESCFWNYELTACTYEDQSQLTFNGKHQVTCEQVFYGYNPLDILPFFEDNKKGKSVLQKIKKQNSWSCIATCFTHDDISFANSPATHLLLGSKNIPVIGKFIVHEDTNLSLWFSFVPEELTKDDDTTGGVVKEIKRQLKRAYPAEFQKPLLNRTSISPMTFSDLQKACPWGNLEFLPSWKLISSSCTPHGGLAGDLLASAYFIENLSDFSNLEETSVSL